MRHCCCTHPKCGRHCNNYSHKMSSFKGEHRAKVLRILIPSDSQLRAKVHAKPGSYRVHTSHWSDEDKQMCRGALCIKDGALPRAMNEAVTWQPPKQASTPAGRGQLNAHAAKESMPVLQPAPPSQLQGRTRSVLGNITNTAA